MTGRAAAARRRCGPVRRAAGGRPAPERPGAGRGAPPKSRRRRRPDAPSGASRPSPASRPAPSSRASAFQSTMSESPATRSSTRHAGAGVQKIATWSEISCPSWKSFGQWMKKWPFCAAGELDAGVLQRVRLLAGIVDPDVVEAHPQRVRDALGGEDARQDQRPALAVARPGAHAPRPSSGSTRARRPTASRRRTAPACRARRPRWRGGRWAGAAAIAPRPPAAGSAGAPCCARCAAARPGPDRASRAPRRARGR